MTSCSKQLITWPMPLQVQHKYTYLITHHNNTHITPSHTMASPFIIFSPHKTLHILAYSPSQARSLTFQNSSNKSHKLYITGIPLLTSIQPSMSHLSHITLSLTIPLPFPQLVAWLQHPKPGRGSPNFCRHPLIFLLLSVVEIPGVVRSLVAEHSIVRNWALFERGFSAPSHLFWTKRISRLRSPRRWLSGDVFGSVERCWHPFHVWEEWPREIDSPHLLPQVQLLAQLNAPKTSSTWWGCPVGHLHQVHPTCFPRSNY